MKERKIVQLKGPDRVRRRPAVIYGSDDLEGVQCMVKGLLEIYVTEAQMGHCHHLEVTRHGAALELRGDDRGLYLGQDRGDDGVWQRLFCELSCLPACPPDESGYSLGLIDRSHHLLYGEEAPQNSIYYPDEIGVFEMYAAQCVCKYMDVTVNRNGVNSTLRFARGYNVGGICSKPTTEPNGTCFRIEPDDEVFEETVIPDAFFLEALEMYAMLCPGLRCVYTSDDGQSHTFYYPGGVAEYVQSRCGDPVYSERICARGRERYNRAEYEACVEVAVGYSPNKGSVKCIHNFRELTYGGRHCEELQKQISCAFNDCYRTYDRADGSGKELTFQQLAPHLTIVLVSHCTKYCTRWENGTRRSIENQVIADMTQDAMAPRFCNHLYLHKEVFRELVEAVL